LIGIQNKKLMNVLIITSLFPNNIRPDAGNFIFRRMAAVDGLGNCRIEAIAPIPYCPNWAAESRWGVFTGISPYETREGIKTHHPRYPLIPKVSMPFHGLLMWLGIRSTVLKLHRRNPFDLIDGHFVFPDGQAALFAGRALGLPVVISARGSDIHQYPTFKTIRPQIVWTLKNADRVISVCKALENAIVNLGIPEEKIDVIPNGIDASRFQLMQRVEARNKLRITNVKKVILSIGHLVPVKGHERIIDAMNVILSIHPESVAYIIGDGPERNRLQDKIKSHGLQDNIYLVGHKPNAELKWWYNAADVFCLTSHREGWPNVLMESMACGTPVVATNVYGTPEIVDSDEVGIIVAQQTESIASGLIAALDRSWDRNAIRKHVAGRTWDTVAKEVRDVFENVLESRKAGKR